MRPKRILDMVTGEETLQTRTKKLREDIDELQQEDIEMKGDENENENDQVNGIIDNDVSTKVVKQSLLSPKEITIKENNVIQNNKEEKSETSREPFFSNKIYEELKSIYDEEFYRGVDLEGNL